MTGVDTAALRDLLAKATPGEWEAVTDDHGRKGIDVGVWADQGIRDGIIQGRYVVENVETPSEKFDPTRPQVDAALIAALVNAAPVLLDAAEAVERVQALSDAARADTWRIGGSVVPTVRVDDLRAALAPPPHKEQP